MNNLKKLKNQLLLLSLMTTLGTNLTGCSSNNKNENKEFKKVKTKIEHIENTPRIITEEQLILETIIASRKETTTEDVVIDTKEEVMDLINSKCIKKIYYVKEDTSINIPSYLSSNGIEEHVILPKLECLEVYDKTDDLYLVKTNEYIGYVKEENLEELSGTFVVVDISSQEVKLYSDNELLLTTPVVTGKPSTPSDQGLFEIYDISGPRYLIGPNYKSYVDVMMKYNGGEGLHDAEYHEHEDGFKHGWRGKEEFGGETYLTDGSHGCINMLREDVMTVKDYVEIGTKVLVKQ